LQPPALNRQAGKGEGNQGQLRRGEEGRAASAQEGAAPPKETPKPKGADPKVVNLPQLPKDVPVAPPKGFKVLPPPVNVPTNLPTIDLSKAITNENDFSGKGVAGGSSSGVKGGTGKEGDTGRDAGVKADHGPYMEFQVEKPVEKIGGEAPTYPPY